MIVGLDSVEQNGESQNHTIVSICSAAYKGWFIYLSTNTYHVGYSVSILQSTTLAYLDTFQSVFVLPYKI